MLHIYASSDICHIFKLEDTLVVDVAKALQRSLEYLENGTTIYLYGCPLFGVQWGAGLNESTAKDDIKRIICHVVKNESFLNKLPAFLQENKFELFKSVDSLKEDIVKSKLRVEC